MAKDKIKGGKSEGMTPKDLAIKHSLFVGTIEKEIEAGIKIEMEHTDDKAIAKEIAMDHIFEFPDYYTNKKYGLKAIEKKLEKQNESIEDKSLNTIITNFLKKYKDNKIPDKDVHDLSDKLGIDTDKLESKFYEFAAKYVNESDLKQLGPILKENIGLSITDETPTELTYKIIANDSEVGEISVRTNHPDLGSDSLEIIGFKMDPKYRTLKTAIEAVNSLWPAYEAVNKIVVSPADEAIQFWTKLGFARLNEDYYILLRGH